MNARSKYEVWLRASLQPATLFGLTMIAACWIGVAFVMSVERDKVLEGAVQQSENLVRLFEENTVQTFERFDQILLLLRKSIEDDPDHFNLRDWAERTALVGNLTVQLALIGADGYQIATTADYTGPPLYLGDREHFRAHVDGVADRLFISKPVLGRSSGRLSIQFSRRVRTPSGGFGGVIVISVDPNFVDPFFETVDLGAHGTVVVRNLDGAILAGRGFDSETPGRVEARRGFRDALVKGSVGHYWSDGGLDGVNRLVAYRASKKFPLIFLIGRAESVLLESAQRNRLIYLSVAAIVTFLVLLAVALGIRHQVRLDRVRDNLRRSEADARERARELEVKSHEIAHIAHHDALTGLANRVLLNDRINRACARAQRDEESFAIMCLDLDRFKIANDTLGHQAGDALLGQVAKRLKQCARGVDTIARVGGDEFVLLQADVVDWADVSALAKRILQAVSAPYDVGGNPVVISASIGIVLAPSDGASADKLLGHADLALYRAKSNGRNAFCFFEREMEQTALKRRRIEVGLRDALAKEELELWYQPWFNIESGRIVGCEALVRWRHPERGLLAPAEFLSIAEETGLIGRLGDWVLHRGCRDAALWPPDVKLAINLSAAQFIGGNLHGTVLNALTESGLDAKRLELEITETLLIDDFEGTRGALGRLRSLGISIALDDFGTGYSSLTHLQELLFDRIKIDKSFVAEVTTRRECAAIVSAVVALGSSLGVSVTAEGVETHDQLAILRIAGCVEVQGYFLSRPMPLSELSDRLSAKALEELPRDATSPATGDDLTVCMLDGPRRIHRRDRGRPGSDHGNRMP
jgi:diguanylate cyclase (GGDEF)-like protein